MGLFRVGLTSAGLHMTSTIRSTSGRAKKQAFEKGDNQCICPITCKIIPHEEQVTFVYKVEGKAHKAVYDKKAIDQWIKRYSTCPVTNLPLDQLKDNSGKIVWKKSPTAEKSAPLTLKILLDTRARIDHLDRAAAPALEHLEELLKKGDSKHQKHLKELGIAKTADLKKVQEKIDRLAMLVTTASFFKRVELADQSVKNLVKLLVGIDDQINELLKKKLFKGFAKQTLKNKQAVAKNLIEHLEKLKSQKGAALEKSFCKIASSITSPLEIEQICTLAPQVLLYPQK